MGGFLLVMALAFMMIPAFFSLIFASRNPLLFAWNSFWYLVMGAVASSAFETEKGYFLSVILISMYIFRGFFRRPEVDANSVFRFYRTYRFQNLNNTWNNRGRYESSQQIFPHSTSSDTDRSKTHPKPDILEPEFRKI